MKKFCLFFLLVFFIYLNALEFSLKEFRELPSDFQAQMEPVSDLDMEYCTVLRIESEVPEELTLQQKIYRKETIQPGEYYFYITHKENNITFEAPEYLPLTVDVPQEGLKKGIVYYVRLETIPDVEVTLNIDPAAERVILDNKVIDKSNFRFPPGKYRLQIEKQGYQKIDEIIEISSKNTIFNYSLSKEIVVEKPEIVQKPEIEKESETEPIPEPEKPQRFIFELYDFIFEVTSCEMVDRTLIIEFVITNKRFLMKGAYAFASEYKEMPLTYIRCEIKTSLLILKKVNIYDKVDNLIYSGFFAEPEEFKARVEEQQQAGK